MLESTITARDAAERGRQLNQVFSLGDALRFELTPSNLICAKLLDPVTGHRGEVFLLGAHVTRWITPKGEDLLFVSEQAEFKTGTAIRGGIPVIFPQFGNKGEMRAHGFARISEWEVESSALLSDGVELCLRLGDNQMTREMWQGNAFTARMKILLGAELMTELTVQNNQDKPFDFTCAFHTYHRVSDISRVRVLGLQGVHCADRLRPGIDFTDLEPEARFAAEFDRDYHLPPKRLQLIDEGAGRIVTVQSAGLADATVWNPWIDKARSIKDFGDDEYKLMVCIEPGNVIERVGVQPRGVWVGRQTLSYAPWQPETK